MINYIRFKYINDYPIGEKPIGNVFYEQQQKVLKNSFEPGPRFGAREWLNEHEFDQLKVGNFSEGWDTGELKSYTASELVLDDTLDIQMRRLRGTNPVVHILLPTEIQYIEYNDILKSIATKFSKYKQVKFLFSNTWDLYTNFLSKENFNLAKYVATQMIDIEPERIHVYARNQDVVDQFQKEIPGANIKHCLVYYNRLRFFNREEYIPNTEQRSKHFLCLNHTYKWHRKQIFDLLPKEKSYKTMVQQGIKLREEIEMLMNKHTLPMWQDILPHKIYNDSYINIATETFWKSKDDTTLQPNAKMKWFTEKTLKPIYFKQMFLVAGYYGQNESVQESGFQLFEDFINYDFDQCSDDIHRMTMLKNEILRLSNIPITDVHKYYTSKSCQDRLDYNYNLYLEKSKTSPEEKL